MSTTRRIVAVGSNMLGERSELRSRVLRMAVVTPFPRDAKSGVRRRGHALDESESGLCLQLEAPVAVGSRHRVVLENFDGKSLRDEVVRVAWCRARTGGCFNAGLEVIDAQTSDELLCVQHASRRTAVAIERRE